MASVAERDAADSEDGPFAAWPRAGWPTRSAGALVATAGFWVQGGIAGLATGVALAIGALGVRGWTLFALGQVAVVALLPQGGPPGAIAVVEAGLFGLLLGEVPAGDSSPRAALEGGSVTAVLGLLAWGAWHWRGTPWAIAQTLVVVAVVGYGLHRYERLSLGYLEDHRERH